jgi:hypothetical protein
MQKEVGHRPAKILTAEQRNALQDLLKWCSRELEQVNRT